MPVDDLRPLSRQLTRCTILSRGPRQLGSLWRRSRQRRNSQSAQDFDSAPSPDQIPGLVEYGSQSAMAPAPRRRAMSDWDLYAGSVYANTSPIWFQAEYLLWWIQGNPLPPLVTTSPEGTPQSNAGVLGAAGTGILFGDERSRWRSTVRVSDLARCTTRTLVRRVHGLGT